jgi:hypothetical protein
VPKIEKNKRYRTKKWSKLYKKNGRQQQKCQQIEVPTNRSDKTINGQNLKKMAIHANNKSANK